MQNLSLPSMTSAKALCFPSKVGYTHKHKHIIFPLYAQLLDSCECLPLSTLPNMSRAFFDSPALVSTLVQTYKGQRVDDDDEDSFAEIIQQVIDETEREQGKLQRNIYSLVRDRFHQSDLANTFKRRCNKYLSCHAYNYTSLDWPAIFSVARCLGAQIAFSPLKTTLGSWITVGEVSQIIDLAFFVASKRTHCST